MTKSTTATLLNSLVFVLGAADPEMQAIELAIEHICQQLGVRANVKYAAFVGADGVVARCHGGVAYKATHLLDSWALVSEGLDDAISTVIPAGRTPVVSSVVSVAAMSLITTAQVIPVTGCRLLSFGKPAALASCTPSFCRMV